MSENLPARAAPKPQVVAGGQVAALVPQNIEEAFRLAGAMAASGMAPRGMDKPEQVMIAILAGAEIGFAPYQAMQSFAIVNSRATLWGDAIPALLWSHGFKLREWFDNEDAPTRAYCEITRPDGTKIERRYSLDDAKTAGLLGKQGPWQTARPRMLQMRARGFAARDGAADVLKGLAVREEVEDYAPITTVSRDTGTGMRARLEARQTPTEGGFDADHIADTLSEVTHTVTDDAEFTDPNIDEPAADEPVARDDTPEPEVWDHMAWAQATREQADSIKDEPTLRTWWNQIADGEDYANLGAADEGEALALRAHVIKRGSALKAAAQ